MPKFRNTDYEAHSWQSPNKPLQTEGFVLFILSEMGNSADFRGNILGAISALAHEETWDYDTEISSAYAQLEVYFMDFCEKVRECVLNNQQVKDAILSTLIESGYYPNNAAIPMGQGQGSENIIEDLLCADNDLKGYAKSIVEYFHAVSLDALQIFQSETQESMFVARLFDLFPIIGDLPIIDDISDIASWIEDVLVVQYEAGYTELLLDEIVCAIYAQCCFDCELTPFDIIKAYATLGAYPILPSNDIGSIVELLKGTMSDRQVVLLFHSLVAGSLSSGSKVLGYVGVKGLRQIVANSLPYAIETCDECAIPNNLVVTFDEGGYPVYTYEITSLTGHAVTGGVSTHTSGNCLVVNRLASQSDADSRIILSIELPQVSNLNSCVVEITGYRSDGTSNGAVYVVLVAYDIEGVQVGYQLININPVTLPDTFQSVDFGVLSIGNVSNVDIIAANTTGFIPHGTRTRLDTVQLGFTV